jgi:hypothetical protein
LINLSECEQEDSQEPTGFIRGVPDALKEDGYQSPSNVSSLRSCIVSPFL